MFGVVRFCLLLPVALFFRDRFEAFSHDFGAVDDVDEGGRVDVVEVVFELDHVGAVEGDVDHITFSAAVKALAHEEGTAAVKVFEDKLPHGFHVVGHDIDGLVALQTVHNQVDDLAFDVDQEDGIDGQTDLFEGDEGGEGDDGIDDHHEGAEGDFRVFVDDHGDDVAAAGSGSRSENQTDSDTVDEAGHHGVQEVVGHEEEFAVRNLYHVGHTGGFHDAFVYHGVITPESLYQPGECEYQDGGKHGFETELRTENPGADEQQRDVHADGVVTDFPRPDGVQHVGKTVGAAGCQKVRVDKHHVADGKKEAAGNQQQVCDNLFFNSVFLLHFSQIFAAAKVLFFCFWLYAQIRVIRGDKSTRIAKQK